MLRAVTRLWVNQKSAPISIARIPFVRSYSSDFKQQTKKERIATLLHVNQLCQMSSYHGCGEEPSGVSTSVIPYCILNRNQGDEIFAEFSNTGNSQSRTSEESTSTIKARKSEAVLQREEEEEKNNAMQIEPYDRSKCIQNYEVIMCTKSNSPHVKNLESSPHPFVGTNSNAPNSTATLVSITVGHASSNLNKRFLETSRFPPRAVVVGRTEAIPVDSKAASLLWRYHFRQHPNVSNSLKRSDLQFYRLGKVKSAQFIDLSGKLSSVESVSEFLSTLPDPLHKKQQEMIDRLNTSTNVLDAILQKFFNLKLSEKFAFELDRYGIRVMGHEHKDDDWAEYYLDYGYEIKTESQLQEFFFKFH